MRFRAQLRPQAAGLAHRSAPLRWAKLLPVMERSLAAWKATKISARARPPNLIFSRGKACSRPGPLQGAPGRSWREEEAWPKRLAERFAREHPARRPQPSKEISPGRRG